LKIKVRKRPKRVQKKNNGVCLLSLYVDNLVHKTQILQVLVPREKKGRNKKSQLSRGMWCCRTAKIYKNGWAIVAKAAHLLAVWIR